MSDMLLLEPPTIQWQVEDSNNTQCHTLPLSVDVGGTEYVGIPDHIFKHLWTSFKEECDHTTTMDSTSRFASVFRSLQPILIDYIAPLGLGESLTAIQEWAAEGSFSSAETYRTTRDTYHHYPDAAPLLGKGSRSLYLYVRQNLEVPFLRTSMLGSETLERSSGQGLKGNLTGEITDSKNDRPNTTLGALITRIYEAVRAGKLHQPMLQCISGEEDRVREKEGL